MFAALSGWLDTGSNSITIKKGGENENRKNNRIKKR